MADSPPAMQQQRATSQVAGAYSPLYDAAGVSKLRALAASMISSSSSYKALPVVGGSVASPKLFFNDRTTSDFIIACEGREIAVHKSVLIGQSAFLKRFLEADASCARINANNASAVAMEIVLKSLYENPLPGREFGAFHYNTAVVASVWEISMHFGVEAMAAVATSRLIQLIDKDSSFRILQATLKHPAASNAKTLQQHIVRARALPPRLNREQEEPWRAMVQKHVWLQEALDEATQQAQRDGEDALSAPRRMMSARTSDAGDDESHLGEARVATQVSETPRRTPPPTPPPPSGPTINAAPFQESIGTIRESYQKYLSLRSLSAGKAAPGLGLTPPPSGGATQYQQRHTDPTPTKSLLDGYADGDDEKETSALAQSTMKLREVVHQMQDDLVDLQTDLRKASSVTPPPPQSTSDADRRQRGDTTQPTDPVLAAQCEAIRQRTEEVKAQYGEELAQHRAKRAQLEAAAADEVERRKQKAKERLAALQKENEKLRAESASLKLAAQEHEKREKEAAAFIRDADVYCRAADGVVEELERIATSMPRNVSRTAARKNIATHLMAAKESRDAAKTRLEEATERLAKITELLNGEEAAVTRLQAVLRDHDAQRQSNIDDVGFY